MAVTLNPYVSFDGNAREALEFYHSVFGGELNTSTFGEFGQGEGSEAGKLMHGQLTADGLTLMAADTPNGVEYQRPAGFSISLSGDDDATLRGYWQGLSEGATIVEPLEIAPWGDAFGILVDRFGVGWMVNIAGAAA
ncbi:VOC family protein [Agromyces intestinalis]|uniref:VOC family protein n=1 Tax=Agromyces intestinalis TaxID=2592652 RepID=A0A5C1YIX1_9MICO|nr:VOC family protein [Agromyces intestinalis]QEO15007.1 VOC family protein [Agromyces intestinalis]